MFLLIPEAQCSSCGSHYWVAAGLPQGIWSLQQSHEDSQGSSQQPSAELREDRGPCYLIFQLC